MNYKQRHMKFLNALKNEFEMIQEQERASIINKKALYENELDESTKRVREDIEKKQKSITVANSRNKLRETLMINALDIIFNEALKKLDVNDVTNNRLVYLNEFINEQESITKLLRECKTKNFMLSHIVFELEKAYDRIVTEAEKEENVELVVKVDDKDIEDYIDQLDKLEVDRIAEIIADKVSASIADFIINNQKDKQAIQDAILHSQKKIDSTVDQELKEHYEIRCKKDIKNIRNRRYKSLFEVMVNNVAEFTYKSGNKEFIKESSLDLDRIMESVTIMYTFLEFTNTMGLVDVNEEYIKNILNQMK